MDVIVPRIHVAVGVILDAQQRVLIAFRPGHVHQGGLWEFPGGKVESGETVQQALARELNEELAIHVEACRPLLNLQHDYTDKAVQLDVWWVEQFRGEPVGREGQPLEWITAEQLSEYTFPEANAAIVTAVRDALLPSSCRPL